MLSFYTTLGYRYLLRRWPRALLVVLSIALGVGTWVATDALNHSLDQAVRSAANPLAGVANLYVTNSTADVPIELSDRIVSLPGVKRVLPLIIENVQIELPAEEGKEPGTRNGEAAVLLGVSVKPEQGAEELSSWGIAIEERDIKAYVAGLIIWEVTPNWFPAPVLVGAKLNERLPVQRFTLRAGGSTHMVTRVGQVRASGAAATLGGNVLLMDCGTAGRLLGRPGKVTRFDIDLHEGVDVPTMQQRLRSVLEGTGADVQTPESQDQRIQDITKGLEIGFKICGAGALVVGLFLVFNTLSVSVAERRHDIGILRSVGATRGQVRLLFLVEALLLGLAGTVLGIPLGLGIASFSLGPMQQVLRDVFLPMHARDIEASFGMFGTAMLAGLSTALLAAVIPASQAAAEEPADAVRRVPVTASAVYRLLQITASVALILFGAVLIALKPYFSPQTPTLIRRGSSFVLLAGVALSGLTLFVYLMRRKNEAESNPALSRFLPSPFLLACAGLLPSLLGAVCLGLSEQFAPDRAPYAGLVLILLGTLLATPLLAGFLIRVGQPLIRGILPLPSRLAADNLVRSPGRTGLVVAALSAGVALMVQTAGVLLSNEVSLDAWVDATLTADLYVSAGGPISATGQMVPMKEAVARHFERTYPGCRVVGYRYRYPDWDAPAGITKIWLNVFDVEKFYEANRGRPNAVLHLELYRRLHAQKGLAVVSDNFAAMHGYKVGDTVTVPGAHGLVPLRIIGTIVDYSWNRGHIHVDRAHHRDDFAADLLDAYEVYFPPGVDVERIREEVQQSPWGAEHALFAMPQPELREHIRAMARRLYALVYPQQIVVGVVALLGVATALLISVLQRRRKLGLLRAAGATRGQVLHSVLAEAVLMGLVGTVIGVVVGLPLEWYVVRVLLFEEAGFLFPVCIPWAGALVIAALAVGCATLAGLWPAFQAMRMRIADAIAYE